MRLYVAALLLLLPTISRGQSDTKPEPFALPGHKGAMLLDLTGFDITQTSAKPGGSELGIRAHDHNHTELLAFLFLTPENRDQTAESCRKAELDEMAKSPNSPATLAKMNPGGHDTPEVATMVIRNAKGGGSLYRYSGSGDQCLSVEAYFDHGMNLEPTELAPLMARQGYDPAFKPTGKDKFLYAEILYRNHMYPAAIPIYAAFLDTLKPGKDSNDMRRIATDNMGIALGMSGRIDEARRVFNDAIAIDPDYPLNYYNLACADAEEGITANARVHLEQAFARKANVIKGEKLPDPTKDDSIQKLKHDKDFWAFVQTLPKN